VNAEFKRIFFKKIDGLSGEDYYRFMRGTQDFVKKYERSFLELARTYKKG
jgi:hypothetical protein